MLHNGKFCKPPKSDATLEDNHINYGPHMDPLMIPLCDSFNTILGLQTMSCCEGHFKEVRGKRPNTFIVFIVDDIKALNMLRRVVNNIKSAAIDNETWKPGIDFVPYWELSFMPVYISDHDIEIEGLDKIRCVIDCEVRSVKEREALFKITQAVLDDIPKAG